MKDKIVLILMIIVFILFMGLIIIGLINENRDAVEIKGRIKTEMKYDGHSIDNFEVKDTANGKDVIIHFIKEK